MMDPVFPRFEFRLAPEAALLVVDMQPCGVAADAGLIQAIEAAAPGYTRYLVERVRDIVTPNLRRLAEAFRRARRPVYFTAFASATGDGRDIRTSTIRFRDRQRRASTGASVVLPRSHPATDVVPELRAGPDDAVLTKTSMDAFVSTPLAADLEARRIRSLVVGGVLTDACVESSARHAAELGLEVTVVDDACAAWRPEFHAQSLASLARYFARVATTDEVLAELDRLASS
jgi:nicotinamidase-related amidase